MRTTTNKPIQALKQLRTKAGYTQRQVAQLCDMDVYRISTYERGCHIPDLHNQIKLARAYQIPLLELQRRCDWPQTPDLMIRGLEQ